MYVHMLRERDLMLRFNNVGAPRWEDRAVRLGRPLVGRYASWHLGIKPGIEVEDEAVVWVGRDRDHAAGRYAMTLFQNHLREVVSG